ncbi:MAG: hypothetical protein J0H17_12750 [Rhizobiales bacterium]|nr:hypothetical protein [Hyphomicrobiales bacterium]
MVASRSSSIVSNLAKAGGPTVNTISSVTPAKKARMCSSRFQRDLKAGKPDGQLPLVSYGLRSKLRTAAAPMTTGPSAKAFVEHTFRNESTANGGVGRNAWRALRLSKNDGGYVGDHECDHRERERPSHDKLLSFRMAD